MFSNSSSGFSPAFSARSTVWMNCSSLLILVVSPPDNERSLSTADAHVEIIIYVLALSTESADRQDRNILGGHVSSGNLNNRRGKVYLLHARYVYFTRDERCAFQRLNTYRASLLGLPNLPR